jgi:PrtD family type I secretion system ABC transporter
LACRKAFIGVGIFSGAINILMLSGSLFMLQVYDRVLPSRSVQTLVGLVILIAVLYAFQGLFDILRGHLLTRIGASLNEQLNGRVFETAVLLPLKQRAPADGLQPLRDLDQVRTFLSSTGPTALFDLPWMPLYLALCFVFHIWIGVTALAGAMLLVTLTLLTEAMTREAARTAATMGAARLALADAARRNGGALQAMGITPRIAARWIKIDEQHLDAHQKAADVASELGGISRVLRMMLQSAVLAVGAYLVINQQATAGVIIASSILVSRALAPVELAIANWKGFLAARQSFRRLSDLIERTDRRTPQLDLPNPSKTVSVEHMAAGAPGIPKLLIQGINFQLQAGQGLGVIGPTAAGKSTLVRALVGVWPLARGRVCFDGASLDQWSVEALGQCIGYLPQDIELFDGTIAENIARFDSEATSDAIIEAARNARVHNLIVSLPDGYDARIGEAGMALSAGQRQRIALARALYGDPFLMVLDEPNSNLDAEGDEALTQAILGVRKRGGIVVVVAHRQSALAGVDLVLAMANGQAQAFGPKDEVLRQVLQPTQPPLRPMQVVSDSQGAAS